MKNLRQWYVVHAKPHREHVAEFHLQRKKLEVFFPRLRLPALLHKSRQIVPLFPSYLFTRIQIPEEYHYTLWTPGVRDLISFNGVPSSVDEAIIDFLKQRATDEGTIIARSTLVPGKEVRIATGPFEGLSAIIQKPPDAKGRIKVLLDLLNRHVKADIPVHHVEREWLM